MSERNADLKWYFINALEKLEGGSTNLFLLRQDLERIVEWQGKAEKYDSDFKSIQDKLNEAEKLIEFWKSADDAFGNECAEQLQNILNGKKLQDIFQEAFSCEECGGLPDCTPENCPSPRCKEKTGAR